MSIATIRVEFDKIPNVDAAGERVKDLRPVFQGSVRDFLAIMFERQFATQGAAYSSPWAPLTRKYAAATRKRRRGGILHLSGRLRASLTKSVAPEGIRVYDRLRMEYGSAVRTKNGRNLASIHDEGRGRNPIRAILPRHKLTELQSAIQELLRNYVLTGEVKQVGASNVP